MLWFLMQTPFEKIVIHCNVVKHSSLGLEWRTDLFRPEFRIIPFSRLFFPVAGIGYAETGKECIALEPGKLYLIPAFAQVFFHCPKYLEKYWMHFNAFFENSSLDVFLIKGEFLQCPVENPEFIRALFECVLENFHRGDPIRRYEMDAALRLLTAPFLAQLETLSGTGREVSFFLKLMLYIDRHLSENLTLGKIAREFGLCPSYLSHLFSRRMHRRLMDYIGLQRVSRATSMLFETDLSISEIADRTGFSNGTVFSKIFKKHTGSSPLEYRKNPPSEGKRESLH